MLKVELISTSRNGGGNKSAARNCDRACYTGQFFVQLVSQQNCETNCRKIAQCNIDLRSFSNNDGNKENVI